MKKFFFFGLIGTVGFIVDTTILLYLVYIWQAPLFISRTISFMIAVYVTWLLNRNVTFKSSHKKYKKTKEYMYYFTIQSIGGLINFIVFFILIYFDTFFYNNLIISMAIASITAMLFNFFVSKYKLFQ